MSATGLHWFRHDLRISDNQAFARLCEKVDKVVAVYVVDSTWFEVDQYGLTHMGEHRLQFLTESLDDLHQQLSSHNIQLLCLKGDPVELIAQLINDNNIQAMSCEFHPGVNEKRQLAEIQKQNSQIEYINAYSSSLYAPEDLPFEIDEMPNIFSPFRKKVEKFCTIAEPDSCKIGTKVTWKAKFEESKKYFDFPIVCKETKEHALYRGGSVEANRRILDYFFRNNGLSEYKTTRNGLDGWDFSSRLSAYLCFGCISPKQVVSQIRSYERKVIKNDSTYWLIFELLWREFFHWQLHKHGARVFRKQGQRNYESDIPSQCKHNDELFSQWCAGTTPYPIVNACMKQLTSTGFMSNRGRQLAASCFIHELGLDWRYGAAFYEHHLIDFDVASNYGNWQYLAGVGSDPRGLRQFNLDKQTQIYDPHQDFINKWT